MGHDITFFQAPRIRLLLVRAPRTDPGERFIIDEKNGAGSVDHERGMSGGELKILRYGFHKKERC